MHHKRSKVEKTSPDTQTQNELPKEIIANGQKWMEDKHLSRVNLSKIPKDDTELFACPCAIHIENMLRN